jgi:hypothetical protein
MKKRVWFFQWIHALKVRKRFWSFEEDFIEYSLYVCGKILQFGSENTQPCKTYLN